MLYCLYNFYYDSEYYCNKFIYNISKIIDEFITSYVEYNDELPSNNGDLSFNSSDEEEDWSFV